jgi:hypothetical protein
MLARHPRDTGAPQAWCGRGSMQAWCGRGSMQAWCGRGGMHAWGGRGDGSMPRPTSALCRSAACHTIDVLRVRRLRAVPWRPAWRRHGRAGQGEQGRESRASGAGRAGRHAPRSAIVHLGCFLRNLRITSTGLTGHLRVWRRKPWWYVSKSHGSLPNMSTCPAASPARQLYTPRRLRRRHLCADL